MKALPSFPSSHCEQTSSTALSSHSVQFDKYNGSAFQSKNLPQVEFDYGTEMEVNVTEMNLKMPC